jgi:hypothetical protein
LPSAELKKEVVELKEGGKEGKERGAEERGR